MTPANRNAVGKTLTAMKSKDKFPMSRPHFLSLEIFRGLASLLVVCFHYQFYTLRYLKSTPFVARLFEGGHAGVEFFFVLSGFIIYNTHRNDIGVPAFAKAFVWKRIIRVIPMYWIVITLSVVAFLADRSWGESKGITLQSAVFDYLLLPTDQDLILAPAWTLKREALFYVLFCVAIFRPAIGAAVLCFWQTAVFCVNAILLIEGKIFDNAYAIYVFDIHNIGFGMGLICGIICARPRTASTRFFGLIFGVGCVLFLSCLIFECVENTNFIGAQAISEQNVISFFYSIAFTFIVVAAVRLEEYLTPKFNPYLLLLGASSYTLYLIHDPLGSLMGKLAREVRLTSFISENAIYFGGVGVAVIVAVCVHLIVERPLTRALRTRWKLGVRTDLMPSGEDAKSA